ncbi:hypothetical protein [Mycobacteroides chelonae]|nr:hypothetical protein Chelonae_p4148 [Mycobacterium sp. QIA-37]
MTDEDDDAYDFDNPEYIEPHPGIPQSLAELTDTSDWHAAPDSTLQRMADWAERVGEGISLTLVTNGGLISGLVITPQDFYRSVSEEFMKIVEENDGPDKIEVARQFVKLHFSDQARSLERQLAKEAKAVEYGDKPTSEYLDRVLMRKHLHLRGAYFHAPNQPSITLGHTRVLLSHVSAWSVGHPIFPT